MTNIIDELKNIFGDRFLENEPMAKHTNFRLGGPAKWFVEAKTVDEIKAAIDLAKETHQPFFVLGGGSNVLVSDEGFGGLIIKIAMREVKIKGKKVVSDAGAMTAAVARQSVEAGLEGLQWAASLPGTIGGAVRGNAGCFGSEMKDVVSQVEVLRDGKIIKLKNQDLKFGYRDSIIKHNADVILRLTFNLKTGDQKELKAKLNDIISKRKASQPSNAPSAGCMFKNYEFDDHAKIDKIKGEFEVPETMLSTRRISSGWLIEQIGLKGKTVGGAQVSPDHGNFLLNTGKATAADIKNLIDVVKREVKERCGIELEEEVQLVGF